MNRSIKISKRVINKYNRWKNVAQPIMLALLLLIVAACSSGAASSAAQATATTAPKPIVTPTTTTNSLAEIKHVIVIFQENWSFDSLSLPLTVKL